MKSYARLTSAYSVLCLRYYSTLFESVRCACAVTENVRNWLSHHTIVARDLIEVGWQMKGSAYESYDDRRRAHDK